MLYRKLGRTDIMVSEIALGCEGLAKKSDHEVKEFVDQAMEQGINFIDFYSPNPDMRTKFEKRLLIIVINGSLKDIYVLIGKMINI